MPPDGHAAQSVRVNERMRVTIGMSINYVCFTAQHCGDHGTSRSWQMYACCVAIHISPGGLRHLLSEAH